MTNLGAEEAYQSHMYVYSRQPPNVDTAESRATPHLPATSDKTREERLGQSSPRPSGPESSPLRDGIPRETASKTTPHQARTRTRLSYKAAHCIKRG